MPLERDYDVVLTIIDRGFSDNVMDAAKDVGATGGTVFHARGAGIAEAEKFLGISIQPEKELVFILVPHELKKAVMQNIYDQCGLAQPGKGLCFSLPVGHVLGLAEKEAIAEMQNNIEQPPEKE